MLDIITTTADYVLFAICIFILFGSIYLTIKLRFVQLRLLPTLLRMLKTSIMQRKQAESTHTVHPHKALFTAMSTTLGISTIVAPVIAIRLGGPGALLGFLLTAFFGSAATFAEVSLSVQHRKRLDNGAVMGGPMQYLKEIFSPAAAKWYAIGCLILMMAWSGAQANQLAAILDSPLLGAFRIPTMVSGGCIAVFVLLTVMGGIKRIGAFSVKLVPTMFLLYVTSSLWIILCNTSQLPHIFRDMFQSAFSPYAMASGTLIGGLISALRWGIFKGIQTSEAGVGTQAIPHSMAETNDPVTQGALAMLSTYTAGGLAFLSGCVALITQTWQDPDMPIGISMVAASFQQYFSFFGVAVVAISTMLFGFGTILGNCYNGSQCYRYLTENKKTRYYLIASALVIFLGAISDVKTVWSMVDLVMAAIVLPHMAALMIHTRRQSQLSLKAVDA